MDHKKIYKTITKILSDSKSHDVVEIDLRGRSGLCDYMFIVTATSSRHGQGIADNLIKSLKELGFNNIHLEGKGEKGWLLIDLGDFIVHIFQKDSRENYKLEELWK